MVLSKKDVSSKNVYSRLYMFVSVKRLGFETKKIKHIFD
jgi:hypothetical protein